ncbi:uncharacterized protein LOC134679202 [Cydia fagiglandana]|uniref:uncharacterized protein LOC134679202 n=1 Tax=Cydia fagiglandana TaxID=1458189 RepID=UPI002FEE2787
MTAQLENVGVYLARSSPVLSEHRYLSSVTDSSMLCIVESDGSHSISCHTLFQTWQPYLPDNCLKFGGASKLSQNSETTSPLARMPTDFIPSRGSIGSQQLFSVSKTAQDLINDYLEQETNPCRSVTVHPKRKIKVNQESQSNIDATPSSHKSSTHAQIIDCTAIGNISESTGVDAVTISSTDHFRVTASTSQNEASKNRGHVKSKVTARSAKSITHRHQSRSYVRRCHAHTWASRSQPVLDQSDSTGCPSLDVTAAAKSLGEALAAKLQALLYSGTSNRKCNCECDCQSSVGKECGTKCQDPLCKNKSMSDKQNDNNSSPGALCYKSVAQKSYFNEDVTSTVNKNISNAQDHPLCKPPCIGLLCGERYKCNEQLNKNTPMEVNISEAPSPAETQTPPLVPPLLKDYCTDSENCRVKTRVLQARDASPATIVLKGPWPGPSKCINESLDPLTSCPGAQMSPDRIPSKNESNCDKPLFPSNQNPATSDTCPSGLRFGDRSQESQTRSLESHYKPVHPYPSKHSSRKGMCLNFRPVAQKTLNYFSRPKYPPRPQKVNDYPSNPQEVRDYPHSSQEVGDYLTSPQELQRYHVNQHCEPPIPQDGISRPQGTQGCLTTPRRDPECPQGYSTCAQHGASRPQGYVTMPGCDPESPQGFSSSAQDSASRPQGNLTTPGCDPECTQGYSTCAQNGASRSQGTHGHLTSPGCNPECPRGYSTCAQHGASRPQGYVTMPGCDPESPQGFSSSAQDSASRPQGNLTTPGCDPECPQGYSTCAQNGASRLHGMQSYLTTPRCDPDCPHRCQKSVGPPYTERDVNRPAILSRSFAQTEYPYEEIKPEKRAKKKKVSGNLTKRKEIERGTDYPCAQVCQDDMAPSSSASSLNSSECVSSLKSANSAKQPKVKPPKKSKASKAPKKSNQATSVKTPCSICQQKLKSAKVKSPKSAKVSKPAKSAEFPCGVCQQKIMSSDSSSSLVISATSVESTKPAKVSNPSKPPKSVEFPCGICQQKLMSSESSIHSISATSANSSKVKCPPIISPGDAPKPIRRTVVKLKDPGSYKPDQEGVISVEQYEKNKRKKKKTKQLSTDMCLPICRQDKKNKKEQYQVVDCVKVSRAVKGAIIRCKCAIPGKIHCKIVLTLFY